MIVPKDGNSSEITKVQATPGSPLQGLNFFFCPSLWQLSALEKTMSFAFLFPLPGLSLSSDKAGTAFPAPPHRRAFKTLSPLSGHLVSTWLFQVRKAQPSKAFAYTVPGPLGAERAASSSLVSSWDDGFHSTPGWGVVAATECMNRSRAKQNHVSHPRSMYVLRVVFLR